MSATELEALRRAWTDPGPRPDVHRAAKARLAVEWPTLYRALVALFDRGPS